MSKIIYQSKEADRDYLIDQDDQQILVYLYLFGPAPPREIASRSGYESENVFIESVDDVLYENKAGLVVIENDQQATLDGHHVPIISLTEDGRKFVDRYKAEIDTPLSFYNYIQEMERIESRIEELLTDVAERLELLDEEEHSQKELDEMMSMLEDYFDQVRSNQS